MNSKNSKISGPRRLSLNLTDKINLKRSGKYVALSNLSIYYTWKNIKKSYKNNKFKLSARTWNEKFELPDGLHSVLDIQDYFEYILKKKHGEKTDNPPIRIYVNKIENGIAFKVGLSPSKKVCVICFIESPLKMIKKCFLFHLESSFRSQDTKVFIMTFWSCRKKGLIRKGRLISKFMTSQPG